MIIMFNILFNNPESDEAHKLLDDVCGLVQDIHVCEELCDAVQKVIADNLPSEKDGDFCVVGMI